MISLGIWKDIFFSKLGYKTYHNSLHLHKTTTENAININTTIIRYNSWYENLSGSQFQRSVCVFIKL